MRYNLGCGELVVAGEGTCGGASGARAHRMALEGPTGGDRGSYPRPGPAVPRVRPTAAEGRDNQPDLLLAPLPRQGTPCTLPAVSGERTPRGRRGASREPRFRGTARPGERGVEARLPLSCAPVAQGKSGGLLSRWSEVRILPGALNYTCHLSHKCHFFSVIWPPYFGSFGRPILARHFQEVMI